MNTKKVTNNLGLYNYQQFLFEDTNTRNHTQMKKAFTVSRPLEVLTKYRHTKYRIQTY